MRRTDQLPSGPTALAEQNAALRRQLRELAGARSPAWMPWPFVAARPVDWPASTAAAPETIWQAILTRVQPGGTLTVGYVADTAGTTGQIQIVVNDTTVATEPVTDAPAATTVDIDLPGNPRDQIIITVQASRTAGTGAVRCQVLAAAGLSTTS